MKKAFLAGTLMAATLFLVGCGINNPDKKNDTNANPQTESQNTKTDYVIGQGDTVLFWGEGCSHCDNVEQFLTQNSSLAEKLNLKKIEVFKDLKGQKIFLDKVKECQLDQAGVPVLYKDGKCIQGDTFIIEELKKNL